ncbi:TIM barrel protein [Cellulophaga sp. HaHaR_3_176]|uniref:sugar phosphate isomerase/epimerase family protein n=1 Tax=Cellulophaga sp. HaHaR_3_176 TaxID=1942464 RepID=UPI001C1F2D83|nr:sugar phosphate isomerase/epimerase family protein [Cellulophaga sp. HaHaR_3_176]QWX85190.1 TIM barrel protein [Cellulophaga sp. HaHaR_3_176]
MSKKPTIYSRRKFTKLSAAGLASIPLLSFNNAAQPTVSTSPIDLEVHLFSKHLQFLNYEDMSAAAAEMGFDGLDLTVRKKGHVLPENVASDLPKAVKAMKKHGLSSNMMSTNVWDISSEEHKTVLKTASKLGFTRYRTDWLEYPEDRSIEESQNLYGEEAKKLALFNEELGIIGAYQNHAGMHVGAAVWDIPPILDAAKSQFIGCQYDIRHAIVEGGKSWELGLRRIHTHINSLVIKDFKWGVIDGKWQPINVPLGEGMVDFNHYFSLIKKYKINVPVSLHVEYDLGGAEKGNTKITIDKDEVLSRIKKDLVYLKNAWNRAL